MKVQLDFAVDNAADAFDDARRFVVSLALAFDVCQLSSWSHGECALMDDLIAGVEFGDDEVDRCSERQHVASVRILIRMEAGERRQQTVM